jgi:hypothetical protein
MPRVILILPEGTKASQSNYDFEVAPVVGSIIEMRVEGEKRFFRVVETWHSDGADGRMRYFAALTKEAASERWTSAKAYVVNIPDAEPLEAPIVREAI